MPVQLKTVALRLLACVCAVAAIMGMIAVLAPRAFADEDVSGVWVQGVLVTEGNCEDVLGDGTVSFDFETATLTLNNATISVAAPPEGIGGSYDARYDISFVAAGIHSSIPQCLTIELIGDNTITYDGDDISAWVVAGICAQNQGSVEVEFNNPWYEQMPLIDVSLRIVGDGSLAFELASLDWAPLLEVEVTEDGESMQPEELAGIINLYSGWTYIEDATISIAAGIDAEELCANEITGIFDSWGLLVADAAVTIEVGPALYCTGVYVGDFYANGTTVLDVTTADGAVTNIGINAPSIALSGDAAVTAIAGKGSYYSIGAEAYYLDLCDKAELFVASTGSCEGPGLPEIMPQEEQNGSQFKPAYLGEDEISVGLFWGMLSMADESMLTAVGDDVALDFFNYFDEDGALNLEGLKYSGIYVSEEFSLAPINGGLWDGETPLFTSSDATTAESPYSYVRIPAVPVIERIAGEYANETSAEISKKAFMTSEWVIVARDDDFADALVSTGLAGALDCPIILTGRTALSEAAAAEIERLGATNAYVIGGYVAIEEQVDLDLSNLGVKVERIYGENSFDTSLECAKVIVGMTEMNDSAIVAMCTNFQDALSISPISWNQGVPVILQTWGDTSADRGFTDDAAAFLAGKSLLVVGGTEAISDESLSGMTVYARLAGETGYDTSNEIAKWAVDNEFLSNDSIVIASGAQDPKGSDALSGSALAGKLSCPILLVNGNSTLEQVNTVTITDFLTNHMQGVMNVYVLGGTYVMPQDLYDEIEAMLVGTPASD